MTGSTEGRAGARRCAVVTGAGRGLGREIALALGRRGDVVHVTDADGDLAASVAAEIGGDAFATRLDVRDAAACAAAAATTVERHRVLDIWVNNAGVLRTGPAWEQSEAQRDLMLDVNFRGTVNGTLAALEWMRPRRRGHVLNVVSLAGIVAAPGETYYSATKHAAIAFSIGTLADLRRTGHRDIHISALCPDGIWTPMLHDLVDDPEAAASWSGVMLQPERVAAAAMALLDHPQPVRALPRRRGALVRVFDALPRVALALAPLVLADARRRQRAFGRRAASGAATAPAPARSR